MHSLDKPKRTFKRDDLKPVVALPPAGDGNRSSWPETPDRAFFYTERPAAGYDTRAEPFWNKATGRRDTREVLAHPERFAPVREESPKLAAPKPEHSSLKLPEDRRACRGKSRRPLRVILKIVTGQVPAPAAPVEESAASRLEREIAAEAHAKARPESAEERTAREDRERAKRLERGAPKHTTPTKAERLSALRSLLELATTDEAEAKLLARIAEVEGQP